VVESGWISWVSGFFSGLSWFIFGSELVLFAGRVDFPLLARELRMAGCLFCCGAGSKG
jgi:hypothetical protein